MTSIKVAKQGSNKAKTQQVVNVALDVGFNAIKMISSAKPEKVIIIPSGVVETRYNDQLDELDEGQKIDEAEIQVQINNEQYAVGEYALDKPTQDTIRGFNQNRAKDLNSQILFKTALAYACPDEPGDYKIHLVTGLPNSNMNTSIEKELREFLLEPFDVSFTINNQSKMTKSIDLLEVDGDKNKALHIVAQPEGSLARNQFEFEANAKEQIVKAASKYSNLLGIIDIGHFTTDFTQFIRNMTSEENGVTGSYQGVEEIYKYMQVQIQSYFTEAYGQYVVVSDKMLDEVVHTGFLTYGKDQIDFTEHLAYQKKALAKRIVKKIVQLWPNVNTLDRIIITGGGAELIYAEMIEAFKKQNVQMSERLQNPVSANVWGFYIYSCLYLLQNNIATQEEVIENFIPKFMFEDDIA